MFFFYFAPRQLTTTNKLMLSRETCLPSSGENVCL